MHKIGNIAIVVNFVQLYSNIFSVSFFICTTWADKREIRCQWVQEDYILRKQTSLV